MVRKYLCDTRNKEIHFFFTKASWERAGGFLAYTTTYDDTLRAIEKKISRIATTQIALFTTDIWDEYALFVHDNTGVYRVKEGKCENSKIQLRKNTNLLKAWIDGKLGCEYGRTRDC